MNRFRFLAVLLVAVAVTVTLAWLAWLHPWEMAAVLVSSSVAGVHVVLGCFPGIWLRRGEDLPDAATDLMRRCPVWDVLSELYLDTELDDRDHERIADVLARSGYGVAQLEEILYRELHPVLHVNLLSVAGEWAGFDSVWLEQQVLQRGPRRSRFAIIPGKWMVRGAWSAVEAKLRRAVR